MNELAFITENPVAVLTSEAKYSEFYARIKAEVSAHVPDVSTNRGRDEIRSLAHKVTRSKTAIDAAGKALNEDARAKINAVDASRRKIRDELDALAEEVRKPLTEWEDAEEDRKRKVALTLDHIFQLSTLAHGDGSNVIADRIGQLEAIFIDSTVFLLDGAQAEIDRQKHLASLKMALDAALKHEADQAELARLRQEAEAREKAERERVEQERRDFEKAQAERLARERAEQAVQEQRAREERAADAARQEEQRKAQEAIAKAEAESRAVKEKAAREEAARLAEIERTRREDERRAANRKHRARIMGAAAAAIEKIGAEDGLANKIVLAIVAGEIPNVTLRF
jgi:colicin import membrane protein